MIALKVVTILSPVFLIVLLGAVLRRKRFMSDAAFGEMNRFVYWIALPCFLFQNIAQAHVQGGAAARLFLVLLASTFVVIVAGFLVARALRLPPSSLGTFLQAAFRANLAYVGLPVVLNAFLSASPGNAREMQALAIVGIAPLIPVYNVAAVLALLRCAPNSGARCFRNAAAEIAKNPLILSCVLGLVALAVGLRLPAFADRTLDAVGAVALPVALLSVGASVARQNIRGRLLTPFLCAVLRVVVSPLVGFGFARLLGLGAAETLIVLILLACPTAVVSHVLVQELNGEESLSGSAIVISTLLSVPVLSLIVALAA